MSVNAGTNDVIECWLSSVYWPEKKQIYIKCTSIVSEYMYIKFKLKHTHTGTNILYDPILPSYQWIIQILSLFAHFRWNVQ